MQRIIQEHGHEYLRDHPQLAARSRDVLKELAACRTGAFGTHERQCGECGYRETQPNSCRNRHCTTCGGPRRAEWLAKRRPQLLPTSYFQVVFTLPHEFIPLALSQPGVLYGLLFRTAWETLQELAADPRYLGARLGAMAVLHTWNQELQPHPHVHFVVPAGGLSPDGRQWIPFRQVRPRSGRKPRKKSPPKSPPKSLYLFPHKVLSRLFRGKFLAALADAYRREELVRERLPDGWREPHAFQQRSRELAHQEWAVYQESPPPGLEPDALVKYLARYVAGMAISDQRLVSCADGRVTFTVKNREQGGRRELRSLSTNDFLSRFLQHVLPPHLTRVRYYGFWGTRHAALREHCRKLITASLPTPPPAATPVVVATVEDDHQQICPSCQQRRLSLTAVVMIAKWRVRGAPLCRPYHPAPSPRPPTATPHFAEHFAEPRGLPTSDSS